MNMKSVVTALTEQSGESVTCIAVNEERHQSILSSVALKKHWREWRGSSVCLSCDHIKERNGTSNHCGQKPCGGNVRAEVATEDAVKCDKQSNGLIEIAVMLIGGNLRTIKCHIESSTQEALRDDSLILPWLVEHEGSILSRCQKRS